MKEGGAKPAGAGLWKAWCWAMVAGLSLVLTAKGAVGSSHESRLASQAQPGATPSETVVARGIRPEGAVQTILGPGVTVQVGLELELGAVRSEGGTNVGSIAAPSPAISGGRVGVGPAGSSTVVWRTGVESDLTIEGEGYFLIQVRQPASWAYQLTRTGDFRVDEAGRLMTSEGGLLMGFASEGTALEPVMVTSRLRPDGSGGWKWTVTPKGDVTWWGLDDLPEVVARIALAVPDSASRLQRVSERAFRIVGMEHDELPAMQRPGEGGAGVLRSGELEAPVPGLAVGSFDRRVRGDSPQVIPLPMPFGLSVMLNGPGCLVVRNPMNDERFWTRYGLLKLDSEGWLVTEKHAYRVQGFSDEPFPGVRDLRVPLGRDAEAGGMESDIWLESVFLDRHGFLLAMGMDGGEVRLGQLKIDRVAGPEEWISESDPFWKVGPGMAATSLTGIESSGTQQATQVRAGSADPRYLDEETVRRLNHRFRFQQQAIERVTSPTSLAISGHGCFLVRDPVTDQVLLTRSGRFHWSDDAYLENDRGWRVQGLQGILFHELVDVRATFPAGFEGGFPESRTIETDGKVWVWRRDGSGVATAWIVLSSEIDPSDWEEVVAQHYRLPEKVGTARFPRWGRAGERGRGKIYSESLERLDWAQDYLPPRVPTHAKQVVLWGLWGRSGRIQFSSDMKGWRDWLEFGGAAGSSPLRPASGVPGEAPVVVGNQVLDPSVVEEGSRFYRIVADEENIESDGILR